MCGIRAVDLLAPPAALRPWKQEASHVLLQLIQSCLGGAGDGLIVIGRGCLQSLAVNAGTIQRGPTSIMIERGGRRSGS